MPLSYDRYCAEIVTGPLPDGHFRDLSPYAREDAARWSTCCC